jgi:hypothetical protein
VDFMLTATPRYPSRWAALLSHLGAGITGTFSLNSDFSGFGQLTEGGLCGDALLALLSWTQDGETHVYLLSGQDRYMGPAGAALDYLQYRWQTLTALMAPAPGVGFSADRPRRPRRAPRLRTGQLGLSRTLRGALEPASRPGAERGPGQRLP